jgi:hypothetical protein
MPVNGIPLGICIVVICEDPSRFADDAGIKRYMDKTIMKVRITAKTNTENANVRILDTLGQKGLFIENCPHDF